MKITDGIETDVEYYWRKTDGWDWFGTRRWWDIFVMVHGINGAGGLSITELWRWNGSSHTIRNIPRNLSHAESRELIESVIRNKTQTKE